MQAVYAVETCYELHSFINRLMLYSGSREKITES